MSTKSPTEPLALRAVLVAVTLLAPATAGAQLLPGGLPRAPLPELPVGLPADLPAAAPVGADAADLRRLRVARLLRAHGAVLTRDPRGEAVVRGQLLAIGLDEGGRDALRQRGYGLRDGAAGGIVLVEVPQDRRLGRALRELRRLAPAATFDYNHLYLPSGEAGAAVPATVAPAPAAVAPARVGLVDSGVDTTHPVFRATSVRTWGCDGRPVPAPHGTAVASLLAGEGTGFAGAAPGAALHAADIYCAGPTGGNLLALAGALEWLRAEAVPVINVSLVGPPNRVLEVLVARLVGSGFLVVAAVGNDGPAAPPLYPAAYPGVVGVTAVGPDARVLVEAGRGPHVDFAAPGAGMAAATPDGGFRIVRGTSFAAPLVAGLLARNHAAADPAAATASIARLAATARDLGIPGRDRTYGDGLLGAELPVPPARVGAREALRDPADAR